LTTYRGEVENIRRVLSVVCSFWSWYNHWLWCNYGFWYKV